MARNSNIIAGMAFYCRNNAFFGEPLHSGGYRTTMGGDDHPHRWRLIDTWMACFGLESDESIVSSRLTLSNYCLSYLPESFGNAP